MGQDDLDELAEDSQVNLLLNENGDQIEMSGQQEVRRESRN